jgi:hypothetical protein
MIKTMLSITLWGSLIKVAKTMITGRSTIINASISIQGIIFLTITLGCYKSIEVNYRSQLNGIGRQSK